VNIFTIEVNGEMFPL